MAPALWVRVLSLYIHMHLNLPGGLRISQAYSSSSLFTLAKMYTIGLCSQSTVVACTARA